MFADFALLLAEFESVDSVVGNHEASELGNFIGVCLAHDVPYA